MKICLHVFIQKPDGSQNFACLLCGTCEGKMDRWTTRPLSKLLGRVVRKSKNKFWEEWNALAKRQLEDHLPHWWPDDYAAHAALIWTVDVEDVTHEMREIAKRDKVLHLFGANLANRIGRALNSIDDWNERNPEDPIQALPPNGILGVDRVLGNSPETDGIEPQTSPPGPLNPRALKPD